MPNSVTWAEFIKDLCHFRYQMNGSRTDVTHLCVRLTELVKMEYPINSVPPNIVNELKDLMIKLQLAEDKYEEVIDLIITSIKTEHLTEKPSTQEKVCRARNEIFYDE